MYEASQQRIIFARAPYWLRYQSAISLLLIRITSAKAFKLFKGFSSRIRVPVAGWIGESGPGRLEDSKMASCKMIKGGMRHMKKRNVSYLCGRILFSSNADLLRSTDKDACPVGI